ncbi:hypothetical protein ScalyP_jg2634 [Parmales sp. scaly parma]|nr:hypothetical protein ScalyP_jg2634 [Parmales sp. scaly parma]
MQQGKANRATAPTLMNAESSRSHSLLMITVSQKNVQTEHIMRARLVVGDLAGSERIKKTKVTQMRLEEAKKINQSLTTLGMVINALTDGSSHVPYRNSKLTRVLQESLGGNSRTALIICCSPESEHASETISTLRFGERASRIRNKIVRNEELSAVELKKLLDEANSEIERLQAGIGRKERELEEVKLLKGVIAVEDRKPPTPHLELNNTDDEIKYLSNEIKQLKVQLKNAEIDKIKFNEERRGWERLEERRLIEEGERDTITSLENGENEAEIYDLKERLEELGGIAELLAMEKQAHREALATNQSLNEAMVIMARERVEKEKEKVVILEEQKQMEMVGVGCQTNNLFIEDLIDHNGGLNVTHSFTVDPPNAVKNLKTMSSEIQSMLDQEVYQLEQELEDAETLAHSTTVQNEALKSELFSVRQESSEVESGLRRELLAARKQIEAMNDREDRAMETVEKRRSSRGAFWSPTKRLSDASEAAVRGEEEGGREGGGGGGGVETEEIVEEATISNLKEEVALLEHQYHSNLDAHALVLETKEEVLRSLLKQNASIIMQRSTMTRERDVLQAKVDELVTALKALKLAGFGNGDIYGGGGEGGGGEGEGPKTPTKQGVVNKKTTLSTA